MKVEGLKHEFGVYMVEEGVLTQSEDSYNFIGLLAGNPQVFGIYVIILVLQVRPKHPRPLTVHIKHILY